MSRPVGAPLRGRVRSCERIGEHLVRITVDGLIGFASIGVPDEWVALTVPGQYQNRYYTVRSWDGQALVVDVVVHRKGLVTQWVQTDCVGQEVGISLPSGSYAPPQDAGWVVLVGDLTALPAVARIAQERVEAGLPAATSYLEVPAGTCETYPDPPRSQVHWLTPPHDSDSALAEVVRGIDWPEGPGYFWMAGESAQMREIRRHLRHEVGFPSARFDVMGYWSGSRGRRARSVDPAPIWRAGKALGKSDDQIWADYDTSRE